MQKRLAKWNGNCVALLSRSVTILRGTTMTTARTSFYQLTVKDSITVKFLALSPQPKLHELTELFSNHQIRGEHFVDLEGRLIGATTSADLGRLLIEDDAQIIALDPFYRIGQVPQLPQEQVSKLMPQYPVTVQAVSSVTSVASTMLENHVIAFSLSMKTNALGVIVTTEDLLRVIGFGPQIF